MNYLLSFSELKVLEIYLLSGLMSQGWIGYAGTHVPMFVPNFGLIKPGQT